MENIFFVFEKKSKIRKMKFSNCFSRISKQKWVGWIAPRVPSSGHVKFENRSALAEAVVQNPQNDVFSTGHNS